MKPEFAKIGDIKYKINTDFRVALECDKIARDETIGEYEKVLAVIYKLFGDKGLTDRHNHEKLLELGLKYLTRGNEEDNSNEEPDMDFNQDKGDIKSSFFSVYGIPDVFNTDYMHFYDFQDYLNGLTEDCALNQTRYIRNYDISDIKDHKEKEKWIKLKKSRELKKVKPKLTVEQQAIIDKYKKLANQK